MSKEYRIPKNTKIPDLVRGIINASYWHWQTIDKLQHTEAITYLQRLEAIDNAELSEALKCLDTIKAENCCEDNSIGTIYYDECNTIKQALIQADKINKNVEICKKANEQKYVYIKETYGIIKEKFLDDLDYEVLKNRLYVNSRGMYYDFPLKDYGIWWALTKEELANE